MRNALNVNCITSLNKSMHIIWKHANCIIKLTLLDGLSTFLVFKFTRNFFKENQTLDPTTTASLKVYVLTFVFALCSQLFIFWTISLDEYTWKMYINLYRKYCHWIRSFACWSCEQISSKFAGITIIMWNLRTLCYSLFEIIKIVYNISFRILDRWVTKWIQQR